MAALRQCQSVRINFRVQSLASHPWIRIHISGMEARIKMRFFSERFSKHKDFKYVNSYRIREDFIFPLTSLPLEKKSGVVYQIPCSCGQVYIGETKRALETRMKEYKAATRRGEPEKSAIAGHAWTHHHPILWDETKVLDEAANNTTLLIKEAIHIRLADTEKLLNRDEGVAISDCWSAIWSSAHRRSTTTRNQQ